MSKTLFIVEGFGKKKLFNELQKSGKIPANLEFGATVGHLFGVKGTKKGFKESLAVDLDSGEANYVKTGAANVFKQLEEGIKRCDKILIATDPDDEGHVIGYHFYKHFKKLLKDKIVYRGAFAELTAKNINAVLDNLKLATEEELKKEAGPGLVRTIMDRSIGRIYSSVLISKLGGMKGVSAGRVQTPGLRLLFERDKIINSHKIATYNQFFSKFGNITAEHLLNGTKNEIGERCHTEKETKAIYDKFKLDGALPNLKEKKTFGFNGEGTVVGFIESKRERKGPAPFKKSSLLPVASSIGISVKKTEVITQGLFTAGILTYPRGDTVTMDPENLKLAYEAAKKYGEVLDKPTQAINKGKAKVQDGHSATTPTTNWLGKDLKEVKEILLKKFGDEDYYRMFELVYNRTLASQMKPAIYETQKLTIEINGEKFVSKSEQCIFKGFLEVYDINDVNENENDNEEDEDKNNSEKVDSTKLSGYKKGDKINIDSIIISSHETRPQGKYNEASFVKALEAKGIGRPSTFKSIIESLKSKEYVELARNKKGVVKKDKDGNLVLKDGKFSISDKGIKVIKKALEVPLDITDYDYTLNMGNELEGCSNVENKAKIINKFLKNIKNIMSENKISQDQEGYVNIDEFDNSNDGEPTDIKDPFGEGTLTLKNTQYGKALYSKIGKCYFNEKTKFLDKACPKCGGVCMETLSAKNNPYIACVATKLKEDNPQRCDYFEGKGGEITDLICPKCGKPLERKTSDKGIRIVCTGSDYRDGEEHGCDFAGWIGKVLEEKGKCPVCDGKLIVKAAGSGKRLECINSYFVFSTKQNGGCSYKGDWYND